MRLGLITPIVSLNPRFDPPAWEVDGGIDDLVVVAREAERLGYDWVSCPEHVAVPVELADQRGGRYWDPVATLSYLAACTSRIGLLSHVVVLGYHHPLEIVKRYGTLDVASGGRVILGVGVGSLRAEFELLGAEFEDRGPRADDALGALRASFGVRQPDYHGTTYRFADLIVDPSGLQPHLPIWVGGRTRRSLRRALALGDGWIPFGLTGPELEPLLADPALADARAERDDHAGGDRRFEVVLAPEPPLDPVGEPGVVTYTVESYRERGATGLALRFVHGSRAHYLEQLAALRQLVPAAPDPTDPSPA